MPGLLRGIARTAVIAGTATHVSNNVSRRQSRKWGRQEEAAEPPPQQQYAPPPQQYAPPPQQYAPPPPPPADPIQQLKELAALKDQGVLTADEFAAQKAKILA
jgi:hypothetical protein